MLHVWVSQEKYIPKRAAKSSSISLIIKRTVSPEANALGSTCKGA